MITVKEIEHLSTLARIKLSDPEKAALVTEFDSIIGYIDQLKGVSVSADAEDRVGPVRNVTRPDESVDTTAEDRERLLAEAPQRVGDYVAVKKILEQ